MTSWPIGIMGWELGRVGKSINYDIRTYSSIVYKTSYCIKVLVLVFYVEKEFLNSKKLHRSHLRKYLYVSRKRDAEGDQLEETRL